MDGARVDRRIPPLIAGVVLAAGGTVIAGIAIAAASAGPLVAHPSPPERQPRPPVELPAMDMPTMPPSSAAPIEINLGWLWWVGLVLAALAAILLVVALVRHLRHRRRQAKRPDAPAAWANRDPFAIDRVGEPADVDADDGRTFDAMRAADDIITTWRAVEDGAARIGMPRRPADTPTEFLAMLTARFGDPQVDTVSGRSDARSRVAGDGDAAKSDVGAAETILPLYHRARFDIERLAPGAASTARACAAALLASWPESPPSDPSSDPDALPQPDASSDPRAANPTGDRPDGRR